MKCEYQINSRNGYEAMMEQYRLMHEQLGNARFLPDHRGMGGTVYDIKPEYGTGSLQVYHLLGNVMLSIYDLVFYDEVVTNFDLSGEYFEIEYCIDGSMQIEEEKAGVTCFGPNSLSISLSRNMVGRIKYSGGQKYQGVSIAADKSVLPAYFGSVSFDVWKDTIESLEGQLRSQYYLGQSAWPEIMDIFMQIYGCRLPVRLRTLFYESKVMETLSFIMSNEVVKREHFELVGLNPYELQKIKEIPPMLMDQLFELPSLMELSKMLVISPKKLSKGFKLVYGDTIFSYHRKLALNRAGSMLLHTDKPIQEIAYDSGYSNPSNFCAAFKKNYGMTPLKYRESSLLRGGTKDRLRGCPYDESSGKIRNTEGVT